MPWNVMSPVEQRQRFIQDYVRTQISMTDLCAIHNISRKTGYKWLERFEHGGLAALEDRSRAPRNPARRTDPDLVAAIVQLRKKRPHWRPKKIRAVLESREPEHHWPAISTIGDILKREGLVRPRGRRRRRCVDDGEGPRSVQAARPNDIFNVDFKGQFRLGDGRLCYPLTVTDAFSRSLLLCEALPSPTTTACRAAFQRLFAAVGLPLMIRSDNGSPFASRAAGRLSRLSAWWVRLGIRPVRITRGRPQENGSHERMHRTLKAETARPPAGSMRAQQRCFDSFIHAFNHERPHEAIGQVPPATLYEPSPRRLALVVPEPRYPLHWEVRRVHRKTGTLKFAGRQFFLSEVLGGEWVGLCEVDDGVWQVYFCDHVIGELSLSTNRLIPLGGIQGSASIGARYVGTPLR